MLIYSFLLTETNEHILSRYPPTEKLSSSIFLYIWRSLFYLSHLIPKIWFDSSWYFGCRKHIYCHSMPQFKIDVQMISFNWA